MSLLNLPEIPQFVIYTIFFVDFFIFFVFLYYYLRVKFFRKKIKKVNKYPDITFIIPVYNKDRTLSRSIESIQNCRYPRKKVKIIVVDDGSTDNSYNIARKCARKHQNIVVYHKNNTGKADSLNFGLKKASTELVAVLDADTFISRDMLEKAVIKFQEKETAAVTAKFKPVKIKNFWEKMQNVEYALAAFKRYLMESVSSLPVAPAFTIFRNEFLKEKGYFDAGNITEDFEMGLRIQKSGYNVGYISDSYAITDVPDNFRSLLRQRTRWNFGTYYNYKKYKELLFNPRYGDLGVFVFPVWIMGLFLSSIIFLLLLYNLILTGADYYILIKNGWLPNFSLDYTTLIFNLTQLPFFLFASSAFIAFSTFFLIKIEIDRTIRLRHYLLMLLAYLWILGLFYIYSFFYIIKGKKPEW